MSVCVCVYVVGVNEDMVGYTVGCELGVQVGCVCVCVCACVCV